MGAGIADRPRRLHMALHRQQRAGNVGVFDDRAHSLAIPAGRLSLSAFLRIGERLLIGGFADSHALDADIETRIVHHGEHACEALVFLADQIADRAG